MSAVEDAAREELLMVVDDLRAVYANTTRKLRERGNVLANTAKDLGNALIAKQITIEQFKDRLSNIADAVKSEALAAGYETESVLAGALAKVLSGLMRVVALALGGVPA